MLCEICHKKKAIMHMVCLVGDKQIDKWLCGECAKDYMPMGMGGMPLTPEGAKRFIDEHYYIIFSAAFCRYNQELSKVPTKYAPYQYARCHNLKPWW